MLMGVIGSVGMAVLRAYGNNKNLEAQGIANRQTAKNYVMSMNYTLQNLQQEQHDAFEANIEDLMKIRLQGNRQESSVRAAVNEATMGGGRTADMLVRGAENDTARAASASVANYQRKTNEIDLNKESALLNTKSAISNIREVKQPSLFENLLSIGSEVGTAYIGAKNSQEVIEAERVKAGILPNAPANLLTYEPDYSSIFGSTDFSTNPYWHFSFKTINPYPTLKVRGNT